MHFSIPKYSEQIWGKQHGGHQQFFFLSRESRPANDVRGLHEFSPQIPSYPEDPKDDTEKEIKVPVPKKPMTNPSQPKTKTENAWLNMVKRLILGKGTNKNGKFEVLLERKSLVGFSW